MSAAPNLVVVESPTKARKISQYLGDAYEVIASVGHVRDLPKSKLGVDVENEFTPTYEVPVKSKKILSSLKKVAKSAPTIYLATDPDREGEAIAWHVLQAWDDAALTKKSKRAVFHEITSSAVKEAIEKPQQLNQDLVDAQQARRVLDRLVGYQISPLLWKKVRRGLSAGRVQSVALRLIVEREAEIEAFVPEEYWEVDLELVTAGGATIVARIVEHDGKDYESHQQADVDGVRSWVDKGSYAVESIDQKERKRRPVPPFTTSTLQQQAATRLGYSAKRTMQLAQQLYEQGLITYHRTDSTALAQPALAMARAYIEKEFGQDFLPEKPNFYAVKSKNAQEAHEAIRPTSPTPKMPGGDRLTETHSKLYDLIFRRFIASQMNPAIYDQTTIQVKGAGEGHTLRARVTGSVIRHAGWLALFSGSEDVVLPEVKPGEKLTFNDFLAVQKFTQPPPRYNDASLVRELEQRGIGRPSTYASIISVISDRGYVERRDKAFVPTAIGKTVSQFLTQHFPDIVDYGFTAEMEDDLDNISLGKKAWQKVLKTFYGPFATKLADVEKTAPRMTVPVEPLDKPCPKCGVSPEEFATLVEQGKSIRAQLVHQTEAGWLRQQPNGELVVREGRFGRFISCSRYPECDYTEKLVEKLDMPCPQCGEGDVVLKKTKRGRSFYGCSRYPECDFASWKKPGTTEA